MVVVGLFDWYFYLVFVLEKWYFLDRFVEIMDNRVSFFIYFVEICFRV